MSLQIWCLMVVKDSYFFTAEAANSAHCFDILIWLKNVFECMINFKKRRATVIPSLKRRFFYISLIIQSDHTSCTTEDVATWSLEGDPNNC